MSTKIVRTITTFTNNISLIDFQRISEIASKLQNAGFQIQTKRIVAAGIGILELEKALSGSDFILSIGEQKCITPTLINQFLNTSKVSMNYDLTSKEIDLEDVNILTQIIKIKPSNTFNFAYTFNNPASSPYFPSAKYEKQGFAIGLQPTNLANNINSFQDWLANMKKVWEEIQNLFSDSQDFLGIDSSIAPLFEGESSLINHIQRYKKDFPKSVLSPIYTQLTSYIKRYNPMPVGLCGLMLPCLEDFELARQYEIGNFDLKTNIFLSLHSGLGIDTYPIPIDTDPHEVLDILKLIQSLSQKYTKPFSIRFVSDGKAKVGNKTNFHNPYLYDVTLRKLVI